MHREGGCYIASLGVRYNRNAMQFPPMIGRISWLEVPSSADHQIPIRALPLLLEIRSRCWSCDIVFVGRELGLRLRSPRKAGLKQSLLYSGVLCWYLYTVPSFG